MWNPTAPKALWAAALLGAALAAGCLGGDDNTDRTNGTETGGPTGTPTDTGTPFPTPTNQTGTPYPTNGTATGGPNGTTNETTWRYDNRTGTLSGTALLVSQPSTEETFVVSDGALALSVVVGADASPDVSLLPPGCEDETCAMTGSTGSTASGNATFEASGPTAGDWTVLLEYAGTPGPVSVEYTLSIGTETEA